MKKLLHERLRETEANLIMLGGHYTHLTDDQKKDIADEIERYYIPRPRFEDGEPVNTGDETDCGTAWVIAVFGDGDWHVHTIDGTILKSEDYDGVLKRPSPKVLDADGVEIKVGDTVWHAYTGDKATVVDISNETEFCVAIDYNEGYIMHYTGEAITHKESDSFEKLRDDMRSFGEVGADCTSDCCIQYADRLSALIEKES